MTRIISPSLLSADFLKLEQECRMLNSSAAEWFHLDIMDGCFVPNISYGIPVVSAIRGATDKILDVHLMIEKPERYIAEFKRAGADYLTVHAEASVHLHRTLQAIRAEGMKAGVALNPSTPLSAVEEVLPLCDMVLIMSVNPGFGGQKFIETSVDKVKRLRRMVEQCQSGTLIQIDGGVNRSNARMLFDAGCDVLVAGNAVFSAADPIEAIKELMEC